MLQCGTVRQADASMPPLTAVESAAVNGYFIVVYAVMVMLKGGGGGVFTSGNAEEGAATAATETLRCVAAQFTPKLETRNPKPQTRNAAMCRRSIYTAYDFPYDFQFTPRV